MSTLTRMDLSKVSLNNQYQVNISGITAELKRYLRQYYDMPDNYSNGSSVGIMCSDATLPTSSFATAEVKDNYQGINQEFAHTRMYIASDFTFYVDENYNSLTIFERWMDYISSGSQSMDGISVQDKGFYRRFRYPDDYKVSSMTITKFEKGIRGTKLMYEFKNAFPKAITSLPVTYGAADLLRVTVSFNYDRYVVVRG